MANQPVRCIEAPSSQASRALVDPSHLLAHPLDVAGQARGVTQDVASQPLHERADPVTEDHRKPYEDEQGHQAERDRQRQARAGPHREQDQQTEQREQELGGDFGRHVDDGAGGGQRPRRSA